MGTAKPLVTAIALLSSSVAFTQDRLLEEVIVTATKRAESLQDIPVTVNAFSSETIQEAGIIDAGDLAIMTPALTINVNTSPFNARMAIRGVGTAQTDPALEPSVGLFVDGVFRSRAGEEIQTAAARADREPLTQCGRDGGQSSWGAI